jgi:hypothetical protein
MMNRNSWKYWTAIASVLLTLTMVMAMPASATTKVSRPAAPRSVHATAGHAAATVNWLKPSSNGGAAISSYVVTSRPAGKRCVTKATRCTVSGLKNGTAYSFTVVAKNRIGAGPASKASNKVTPKAAKASPTLVVTPNANLTNSETVTVSGTGFTPNDEVYLVECLANSGGQSGCDIATATPVTISAEGVLPSTKFSVLTGTIGSGSGSGTCGTTASNLKSCAVSAGNASGGDSAVAPITFKAP